jgi:hypothetical protein
MNKVSSYYSHPVFTPTPAGSQFNESALVGRHGQNRNQRRFQNSDRADNNNNNSQQQSRFQQNKTDEPMIVGSVPLMVLEPTVMADFSNNSSALHLRNPVAFHLDVKSARRLAI